MKLYAHQKNILELSRTMPHLALFWEMGTGKTLAAIEILKSKQKKHKRLLKTVIFSPLVTLSNWKDEILKFSDIPEDQIYCLNMTGKKRIELLEEAIADDAIIILNYESLRTKQVYELLMNYMPNMLICDESHKLKNHQSKQSKMIYSISKEVQYKLLLTGTPILNSTMDIFNQYKVLDDGDTFGRSYYSFRSRYFYDKNAGMPRNVHFAKWEPRVDKTQELQFLIKKKSDRVLKKDCLDLPPLIKHRHYVNFGSEQKKAYDGMKKDFITFIANHKTDKLEASVAQLAITKLLRLQQIVSGFLTTDNGDYFFSENPRANELEGMLRTLTENNKVIVWTTFKNDIKIVEKICKQLGIKYCLLSGELSGRDKERNIREFSSDDETRVIIANRKAGGIGINLCQAKYSINYSRNFSLEDELQSEARNYRGGSEKFDSIIKIDMVAKDTIDEEIQQALENKQTISDVILDLKL